MSNHDLIARQHALEEESIRMGAEAYERDRERREESEMAPGRRLIRETIQPMIEALNVFVAEASSGRAGRRHSAIKYLREIDIPTLAFLTVSRCVDHLALGESPATRVAMNLALAIEDAVNHAGFAEKHPGLYKLAQRAVQKSTSARHSKAVMNNAISKTDMASFSFPEGEGVIVAMKLIEVFAETTGMLEMRLVNRGSGAARKSKMVIEGNEKLMEWLDAAHRSAANVCPVSLPMLIPPRPWGPGQPGGYLRPVAARAKLARVRNKAYLNELALADMPLVYEAVNTIQNTPWQINASVLDVMLEAWEAGGGLGGLPSRELQDLPPKPLGLVENGELFKKEHPEEFTDWKRRASAVHESNARNTSSRIAAATRLQAARRFRDEPAIYFPHSLDFRGRVYPLTVSLTPQGDDPTKALLRFAEGKPLGSEGAKWLAVHVANLFGVDKVPFEERIAWVRKNEELILDSALDPLDGRRFWETADSPWCALAACFEWLGYSLQGEDFVSHLPIALDGSCNGLQNFSAMLRDEVGGAATNLMPRSHPADIYTEVKTVAEGRIRKDAEGGCPLAAAWDGRLTRSMVKRPVMTLPYGVTSNGMRGQILDQMKKDGMDDSFEMAGYLGKVLWECVGQVVIAAAEAMAWLRAAAKVVSAADLPISWTTPAGFPVLQEYREDIGEVVNVHLGGKRVQLVLTRDGTKLDRRRQGAGISPNFVHSCDASHLMLTTVLAKANGITDFAMIHDSYGTHAATTGILASALREAFIEQYERDVLGEFRDALVAQVPPEIAADIPPLPPTGKLDLSLVREARYFFA
ncbi:DNA-directed RNA polymerase [Coralloluteibacterium stylophorae]|uniref:DNA-directed RNA polymerase n=1 Tax=Coralloluteibacterium stylophorae TaxID=1776034 RepID=A0A8J7VRE5_9GAMM|nr:DNA-directed RNA polymerase [Coralloluteibacterium stylophorae]MBS7457668.1 T3/T7 RNA polymerase [Coralloluteibacterium stylophorae]